MRKMIGWMLRCSCMLSVVLMLAACGNSDKTSESAAVETVGASVAVAEVGDKVSGTTAEVQETTSESRETEVVQETPNSSGKIYLYGESHGQEPILEYELELWKTYYHEQGMRHLFEEIPYFDAEFLNLWMDAEDDTILNQLYEDWEGTASQVPCVKEFYQSIKKECPETIFHGTDVGHAYYSTGKRYLEYLEKNGLEGSEQYELTQLAIEQGKVYGAGKAKELKNHKARENYMAENFIREFNALEGESIMGIYGAAHTDVEAMNVTNEVPCMAAQLYEIYGDQIYVENISWMRPELEPERIDRIAVHGKEYEAAYFGKEDLAAVFPNFEYREFWRLEGAYEDFKEYPEGQDVLPYNNYPMKIELEQVFLVKYRLKDGSDMQMYYVSRGNTWNDEPTTEQVLVPEK